MASATASARMNGTTTPSAAEDEELYDQLLRLRDVVLAGEHASFKLPASVIEELKSTVIVPDARLAPRESQHGNAINGTAFATNQTQLQLPSSFPTFGSLPGLQASSASFFPSAKLSSSAGLDPIFLEKSDSLVRAEGQLKRQRLERELQAQIDERRQSSREKDPGVEALSRIDIDLVYSTALERVKPISGLKAEEKAGSAANSSFDENDYYSSQVQSDWSSEASSSRGSDRAAGAFTADYERLDGEPQVSASSAKRQSHLQQPNLPGSSSAHLAKDRPHVYTDEPEDVYQVEDDDDEYTPPDASAIDSSRTHQKPAKNVTPPDDDNSEYEPGEITQDSTFPTPNGHAKQPVPQVVRNHLTHIAAPQPNRVSPLATAKRPSMEMSNIELVNGQPQLVTKPRYRQNQAQSRASSASPSGNGMTAISKKRRNKKRKRDVEPSGRAKRRRERQAQIETPASPIFQEAYIKNEPVSPQPFANVPIHPQYAIPPTQYQQPVFESAAQRYVPQSQYTNDLSRSGLRYEYTQPDTPTVAQVTAPPALRPVQRDSQDLRRVASLHYAKRPSPPSQRNYSPVAPYRAASMAYGDSRLAPQAPDSTAPHYHGQSDAVRGRIERSPSPQRLPEYRDTYPARPPSPAAMPPPTAPPRQFIVDQYGNRYFAAVAAPPAQAAAVSRASVPPVDSRVQQEQPVYERAPARASVAYAQTSQQPVQFEPADTRMGPPALPSGRFRAGEGRTDYADANGSAPREYNSRQVEHNQYAERRTSPNFRQASTYESMAPPPPLQAQEPTSPIFGSRNYSSRREQPQQQAQPSYTRHASVAPVQYVRQDAPPPMRAVSVMPSGAEFRNSAPQQQQAPYQRSYAQAPPGMRFVDAHGNEVFAQDVRQVSEFRY